jgi:hypothetical protein
MLYKKINVELIVVADEAEAVVAELNVALDLLEEAHTLFDGGIEAVAFEHPATRCHRQLKNPHLAPLENSPGEGGLWWSGRMRRRA